MNFKKFGKYTLIKKLASGGMADILLANDLNPTGFGRFVVIKKALTKFSENEEFKDMFKNEGKVACNLKHRNITPIYEFGIEKNQFFMSMEYISGRNLRELSKKLNIYKASISIPNSVHIIKEVASGLNYAHNAIDANTGQPLNLIHRDVSPQNIMLSFDGEIKLIDFGIAKIADTNLTRAGHLKGKFSYMSPEQARGEILDGRTDIFCLGIILWELLTNKRLFASKNELNSLKKIKNCDIPNAQKINPKIPTELNNIIKKALSKNKNSRYNTAAKLEQELSVFLNKNYPEYSHYDFITLMKTTYRKEILEEREKLKTYSSEFKKHLDTLDIEDNLKTQIDLNIPDLSTVVEAKQQTNSHTKEQASKNSAQTLSQYEDTNQPSLQTGNSNLSLRPTSQVLKEDSSTLIQRKNFDPHTETKKSTTKPLNIVKGERDLIYKKSSSALGLKNDSQVLADHTDFFKNTRSAYGTNDSTLKRTQSLLNKKELLEDLKTGRRQEKKFPVMSFLPLVTLICAVVLGFYWMKKNDITITNLITNNNPNTKPVIQQSQPNTQRSATPYNNPPQNFKVNSSVKKVFINSSPSGAAIFINGQSTTKYTPSMITLTGEKTSNIILKKEGYFLEKLAYNPQTQNKNTLNVTLKSNQKRNLSSKPIQIIQ